MKDMDRINIIFILNRDRSLNRHRFWRSLIIFLLCAQPCFVFAQEKGAKAQVSEPTVAKGKVYALVVGVEKYLHDDMIKNLSWSRDDADAVVEFLEASFAKGTLNKGEVIKLVDEKATSINIELEGVGRISSLCSQGVIKEEDLIIVYFSGHGGAFNEYDNYFFAHNSNHMTDAGSSISIGWIKNNLESWRRKTRAPVLFIFDACRSATIAMGEKGIEQASAELSKLHSTFGEILFAGSKGGKPALESFDLKHGFLTYYLLHGLYGQADDSPQDGIITVDELKTFVESGVKKASGNKQQPSIYMNDASSSLPLTRINPDLQKIANVSLSAANTTKETSEAIERTPSAKGSGGLAKADSLTDLIWKFNNAIASKRLLKPSDSSAMFYYNRMKALVPESSVEQYKTQLLIELYTTSQKIIRQELRGPGFNQILDIKDHSNSIRARDSIILKTKPFVWIVGENYFQTLTNGLPYKLIAQKSNVLYLRVPISGPCNLRFELREKKTKNKIDVKFEFLRELYGEKNLWKLTFFPKNHEELLLNITSDCPALTFIKPPDGELLEISGTNLWSVESLEVLPPNSKVDPHSSQSDSLKLFYKCTNEVSLYRLFANHDPAKSKVTIKGGRIISNSRPGYVTIVPDSVVIELTERTKNMSSRKSYLYSVDPPDCNVEFFIDGIQLKSKGIGQSGPFPKLIQVKASPDETFRLLVPRDALYEISKWQVSLVRDELEISRQIFVTQSVGVNELSGLRKQLSDGDRLYITPLEARQTNAIGDKIISNLRHKETFIYTYDMGTPGLITIDPKLLQKETQRAVLYLACANTIDLMNYANDYNANCSYSITGGKLLPSSTAFKAMFVPDNRKVNLTVKKPGGQTSDILFDVKYIPSPRIEFLFNGISSLKKSSGAFPNEIQIKILAEEMFQQSVPLDARYEIDEWRLLIERSDSVVSEKKFNKTTVGQTDLASLQALAKVGDKLIVEVLKAHRFTYDNVIDELGLSTIGMVVYSYSRTK